MWSSDVPVLESPTVAGSPQEDVSHASETRKGMDPEGYTTKGHYFTGCRSNRHRGLDHSKKHVTLTENFFYIARVFFIAYHPRSTGKAPYCWC